MIYFGVHLDDDDWGIQWIGGAPEMVLYESGVRKMSAHAPDQERAARFMVFYEECLAKMRASKGEGAAER